MAETWSGEFYCVKCKEKREAEGEVRVNDKGTRMAKAVCPVCGPTSTASSARPEPQPIDVRDGAAPFGAAPSVVRGPCGEAAPRGRGL